MTIFLYNGILATRTTKTQNVVNLKTTLKGQKSGTNEYTVVHVFDILTSNTNLH